MKRSATENNMISNNPARDRSCCNTAMKKASRRLTQIYDGALSKVNLRSTQFAIMSELANRLNEWPSVTELAKIMVMERSTLGRNLKPLIRQEIIRLIEDSTDRRQHRIMLTEKGLQRLNEAQPLWHGAQERFSSLFGEDEEKILRQILLSIAYNDSYNSI